ncbi:hypothetical protein [Streptomyces sp. NPDC008150]|uniref:hypothetical protein n=1 Tax=Streptomyces sp. NPDC008150 TaxID=3364816 RepID=UPI0036ED12F1
MNRSITALHLGAIGVTGWAALASGNHDSVPWTIAFAGASLSPVIALVRETSLADERWLRRQAATELRRRDTVDWEQIQRACCPTGWATRGTAHDSATCNQHRSAA